MNEHAGKKASHQKQGDKEPAFWNVPTSSGVQSVMKGSHHDADATNKNNPNHQAVSDLYQSKATPHTIAKGGARKPYRSSASDGIHGVADDRSDQVGRRAANPRTNVPVGEFAVAGPDFESYVNSSDTIFVGGDDDDDVEARRVAEEQAEIQAKLVNDTGEQEQMRQDYERLQEEVQAMKQAGSSSRSMEPKR